MHARGLTVAIYEGLTGGVVAQQLEEAAGTLFAQGSIGQQEAMLRRLLESNGPGASYDALQQDGAALTGQLAIAVRAQAGADLGLAVHSVPDPAQGSGDGGRRAPENLGAGRTYIAVASSTGITSRLYNFAGPGAPDKTRTAMHSLDLLRETVTRLA